MEYNKKLVEKAGEVYAQYLIENWRPENQTGIMPARKYNALKKKAMEHLRKTLPSTNLFYAEWLKLVAEHGPQKAHAHVTNTAQETGRRIWIGLSVATNSLVLNTSNRLVMNPDGSLKGQRKDRRVPQPAAEEPKVQEEPQTPTTSKSVLEAYKWRLLGCATHGGVVPGAMGLAELLDISHAEAKDLLDWLERTHVLETLHNGGGFGVSPRPIDAHKLLELFHDKERNPLELRALEALLDAMAE